MIATWSVEVKRFYIEMKERNKKGNAVSVPITHRKMFVHDPKAFLDSGEHRIVAKKGKYTISVKPRVLQQCWSNPSGKCDEWYKLKVDKNGLSPYVRTTDAPMDEAGILRWLTARLGIREAEVALQVLLTAEPERMAA